MIREPHDPDDEPESDNARWTPNGDPNTDAIRSRRETFIFICVVLCVVFVLWIVGVI